MSRRTIDEILADLRTRYDRVHPSALGDELAAGALLVDIRPIEQRERDGELPGALVVPRNELEWRLDPASDYRLEKWPDFMGVPGATTAYGRRVIVSCNQGYQSTLAAATLLDLGLARATDLIGGYELWCELNGG